MKKWIVMLVAVIVATLVPSSAQAALPLEVVQCGEPIDRSVRIANNIFGCTDDGLAIVANGITLDLNGNRVSAGLGNTDHGIMCAACRDVTIRNGSIEGFGAGVRLGTDSRRVTVSNIRAIGNDDGFLVDGARNTLKKSFAVANDPGSGFFVEGTKHTLAANIADDNADDGFEIEGDGHKLESNTSAGNGGDGFDTVGTTTTLTGNLSRDNAFGGFTTNGSDHVLKRNRSDGNSTGFTGGGSGHLLAKNRATANDFDGITTSGIGVTLTENVASGNERLGISIGGSNNRAEGNRATGNDDSGIFVFGSSNSLRENRADGNGENGIEITGGDGHKVVANIANSNGFVNGAAMGDGLGIFVNAAATGLVAKKNRAKDNDDGTQCSAAANCT